MTRSLSGLLLVLRSAATLAVTLAGLIVAAWSLTRLSPIDPALQRLGDHASAGSYAQARHEMGLDAPWPVQLVHYAREVVHGNLGTSHSTGAPVRDDLARVFPPTLELATLALLVGAAFGLALALASARFPHGILDGAIRVISIAGSSVPLFWLGIAALFVVYARLHFIGGAGRLSDAFEYTIDSSTGFVLIDSWRSGVAGAFADALAHLVLPVLALAAYAVASITRLSRAALLSESRQEYVSLARAKGASEMRVLLRHVLPNTAGVTITVTALTYANLLQGAVLIETVFARPGLGRYLTTAIFAADLPALLGATLLIGTCFIVINAVADTLARLLDPRHA